MPSAAKLEEDRQTRLRRSFRGNSSLDPFDHNRAIIRLFLWEPARGREPFQKPTWFKTWWRPTPARMLSEYRILRRDQAPELVIRGHSISGNCAALGAGELIVSQPDARVSPCLHYSMGLTPQPAYEPRDGTVRPFDPSSTPLRSYPFQLEAPQRPDDRDAC